MLKFNETRQAVFTVTVQDITEAKYPQETYEETSPILRSLGPALFDYFAGAINLCLESDQGLIEPVTYSRQTTAWEQKWYEGNVDGPTLFSVSDRTHGHYEIEPALTADFLLKHFRTNGEWEEVTEISEPTGLTPDTVWMLLREIEDPRIEIEYVEDEDYLGWTDMEEYSLCRYRTVD